MMAPRPTISLQLGPRTHLMGEEGAHQGAGWGGVRRQEGQRDGAPSRSQGRVARENEGGGRKGTAAQEVAGYNCWGGSVGSQGHLRGVQTHPEM